MTADDISSLARMLQRSVTTEIDRAMSGQLQELVERVKRQILHELAESTFRDLVREEIERRITIYVDVKDYDPTTRIAGATKTSGLPPNVSGRQE
jgi:flagellar biosynthesis/type III secretory pathway protein FliH